jgi:hypothetical protein
MLLGERKPLFEAGFIHGNAMAIADVLDPVDGGMWDLIEVKSATSVKDINIQDVALQRYCYEGAGLRIRRCILMHVNNEYVRHGEIDPKRLFTRVDITDRVGEVIGGVEGRLAEMVKTISARKCPVVDIGPHCSDPYDCVMQDKCWAHVFKYEDNIFTLYRLRAEKAWHLYRQDIIRNADLPFEMDVSDQQRIQLTAEHTGEPHINARAVRAFLMKMEYPLHFLDFETFATAIPMLDGVRPYQKVPFQFSLHVLSRQGADPVHSSWIWDGEGDPRAIMVEQLRRLLGREGSVIAYNATFESGVLHEAADAYPKHAAWVDSIAARTVDLLEPFRSFSVYHPAQHGSASLKAVLPALTGTTYDGMEISDGSMASRQYLAAMYGGVPAKEKQRILKALEEYCGLDTRAMIDLVVWLRVAGARG